MKNKVFLLILSIIVVVLVGFVFIAKKLTPIYETVSLSAINDIEEGLIYIGEVDNKINDNYKRYKDEYSINLYNINEVNNDELNDILEKYNVDTIEGNGYILISNNVPVWSSLEDMNDSSLNEAIREFVYGEIPDSKKAYIVPSNGDTMVKQINSKKYTVLVIGKQDCNYCTMYLPVFNKMAKNYNIDIYYMDVNNYISEEYKKVTDLKLSIPSECTTDGIDTDTSASFPKPMTLITKNGKTVDCILGYASYSKLEAKLAEYGIINIE